MVICYVLCVEKTMIKILPARVEKIMTADRAASAEKSNFRENENKNKRTCSSSRIYRYLIPVSYTHLTLPTIYSV